MKKRILSVLITVVMLIGMLPTAVFAEGPTSYGFSIGDVDVTDANKGDLVTAINQAANASVATGSATYDPATSTLTLYNFSCSSDAGIGVIDIQSGNIIIKLKGNNTLTGTANNTAGISSNGNLVICNGEDDVAQGQLTINTEKACFNVVSGTLEITDVEVTANSTGNYGLSAKSISLSGVTLSATGAWEPIHTSSVPLIDPETGEFVIDPETGRPVRVYGAINIENSTVKAYCTGGDYAFESAPNISGTFAVYAGNNEAGASKVDSPTDAIYTTSKYVRIEPLKSYTVTLNENGGTINSENVTSYIYGTGATLPADVTKTGHTFGGWYENPGFSGSAVTSISTTAMGDKTYHAKWTPNTYTVNVSANPTEGGTVNGGGTYEYGTDVTVTATANNGYNFVNWTKSGSVVSINATYTFTATEAAEYVANFVEIHTHCICGETHASVGDHTTEQSVEWNAWNGTDAISYDSTTKTAYVYLYADAERSGTLEIPTGYTLNLCLNGMKLYYEDGENISIFTVEKDATLNITDCGTTARPGYIEVDADGDTYLWHEGTGDGTNDIPYNLTGGLITGGTGTVTSGTTRVGGAVYAPTGATVNLYGGNIAGNSAGYGGGIYGKGCTMNIYGGSIVGNTVGGIELVCNNSDPESIIDSSLKIHGGNIEYNRHNGYSPSEVGVSGTITMTGGTVIAESTMYAIVGTDGFTMSGGTVINNAEDGFAVLVQDTWAYLSGGTISAPKGTAVYILITPDGHFSGDIRLSGAPVLEGAVADIMVGNAKVNGVDIDPQNHIVLEGPLTGSTPYTVGAYLLTWDTDEYDVFIYESIEIDENPTIDFTKGWSTYMGNADPADYFINANTAEDAKQIALVDGELWLATPYTVTTYDTNGETRGGSYSVNKTTAIAGETVTITLTPDEGYIFYDIWIYNGYQRVTTTRVNDTTFTFVMPEGDVWVKIDYMMPNLSVTCGEDTYYAEDLIWAFDVAEDLSYEYDGAPVTIKVERDYTEDIESFYNGELNIENSSYSSTPDIILDLNGKDIHFPETNWYLADIGMLLITGYDLTLTDTSSEGDGIIHALVTVDGGNSYGGEEVALDAEIDYDLIVEGGTYRGFMVYTSDKIKISGGTFLGMPQEVVDEMLESGYANLATFIGTKGLLISNNGGFASEAEARAALNAIIADGYATHKDYAITAFSFTGDETDTKYYAGFAANTVVGRSITKEETNNGSFDVKVGEDEVNAAVAGTTVTITATPAEGCEVDSITVVGAGDVTVDVNSDGTFTMPDYAITITVTFKKESFTVTTVVTTGGTVTGAGAYEHGSVATLAAMPNSGCVFMGWFTDDTYQTPFDPTTPITENITVYAKFVDYEGDKKALQEAIGALEKDVTELNKLIETDGTIDQINDKLTEIQNKINLLGNTYATDEEVAAAITAAKNEVTAAYRQALDNAVETLEDKIAEQIDPGELAVEIERVTALINALNNTYATDEETADAIEAAIAEAQAAIATAYEQAIADAVERLEEADRNNASALEQAIDDLEALIGLAENAAAAGDQTLSGQIANAILKAETELTSAKGDLEALIGDVQSNLDQIETDLAQAIRELREAIDQDTSGLSSRISSLSLSIQSAKSQLAAADAENKAALEKQIAEATALLQTAIDQVKADLSHAIAAGDTALDEKITNLSASLDAAKAVLEAADAENKAALEEAIVAAEMALREAINEAAQSLSDAIAAGDTALDEKISALNTALNHAISAYEAADGTLKAELSKKIEDADAALDAAIQAVEKNLDAAKTALNEAIQAVEKNLDAAKTALNEAIADGDTALDNKISALNEALANAKAALEATDSANKSELTSKIDEADAALQAAIDALSTELNATNEKVAELETFITIVCIISGVAFSGCAALAVLYVLDKKKKI